MTVFSLAVIASSGARALAEEAPRSLDLSLDRFVQLVLERSLNSQIVRDSFQSTQYGYSVTKRDLAAPKVNLTSQVSRAGSLASTTRSRTDTLTGKVELTQPFLWGGDLSLGSDATSAEQNTDTLFEGEVLSTARSYSRTFPQMSVSYRQPLYVFLANPRLRNWNRNNINYSSAKNSYERDLQNLEVDARSVYYGALAQVAQVEVERQKLKSSKALLSVTQALVDAGKSAPVELTRVQISYKLDERRLANAETSAQQAINSLKNQILLPEDLEIRLTSQFRYAPLKPTLKNLETLAFRYRLDLLNARKSVDLARMSLQESKEATRPGLSTNVEYRRETQVTGERPENWSASASLSWAIFDSRITSLRVRSSEISLKNSQRQLEILGRQIQVEVRNAYLDFMRIQEQIADFEVTRKQAEDNVEAIRIRYKRGLDRIIDVFDAEGRLRDLDLEYLNLLLNYNKAKDRLGFLVGRKLDELVGQ
jgi:outer membrane protein TolC